MSIVLGRVIDDISWRKPKRRDRDPLTIAQCMYACLLSSDREVVGFTTELTIGNRDPVGSTGLASRSGVRLTFFPAAFFAHQPSGALGVLCFLQILWSATSEMANSFAKCVIGLDQTRS